MLVWLSMLTTQSLVHGGGVSPDGREGESDRERLYASI